MNKYMDEAKAIRASITGLAEGASDEKLIDNKSAFPFWNGNRVDYTAGDILRYGDDLYRVNQPHSSQNDWTPDIVPALYSRITVGDEWSEWEPGSYAKDAKCRHNDIKWISNIDNNVWEPGATGVNTWRRAE